MKAFIFDMDGVIVNSEPLHSKMKLLTLEQYGLSAAGFNLSSYMGRPSKDFFREVLAAQPHGELDAKKLADHKHRLYLERIAEDEALTMIEGIDVLLAELRRREIPVALASSSARHVIETVLARFGLREYFSAVLSGAELPASKPDPAVYLLAAEALGVEPEGCVVLEDADAGITAAKRAGMYCIAYRNPCSGEQSLSGADLIVDSIAEIDLAAL